ncbi:peptide-methionine (R)-S-oxide reductase MsrB [uncultured Brachyspira sp.]|uniref:peptide-methionine (R)-S-oxide reductase MsrB n=1 Tax=uncultured Brachyspira sp. TaxID=221953 RepID=UPI002613A1BE|nr:peptide-methionine (R)-S-oxide reductase MsrB [uncultured Brachyspira sp.]
MIKTIKQYTFLIILIFISVISCDEDNDTNYTNGSNDNKYSVCDGTKTLSAKEYHVLINKGTELPFTGELLNNKEDGIYTCKICDTPLFHSEAKFNSGTGWPSFDDAIIENIKLEKDGNRVEVVCANCGGHLGHVFYNEGFTEKETRYCINSVSLNFINKFTNENSANK